MSFNFVEENFHIGQANPDLSPQFIFYKRGFRLGGSGSQPSWQDIILSGNTALTLTNAIADGLNYLKLFGGTEQLPETYLDTVTLSGGCEQRNLPSEFTQVAYLQSDGTQYINTGVVPKTTLSAKIKYNVLQLTAQSNIAIFGSLSSQVGLFSGLAGNPAIYYINSGTSGTSLPDIPFALNTVREEEYINDTMIRDGVTYTTNPIVENDISMTLFGRNTGTEVTRIGNLRIYYFTLYDNGVLIQNLIPARRNSDNVLGMYDTVSDTFLTNAGTGTFTAGAAVTTPSPDTPMDIVCNNGAIKLTPNLVDTSLSTRGYYINSTGDIVESANWSVSDYIPVTAGKEITISGLTYTSLAAKFNYYNSNEVRTSTINYGNATLTVPNNTSYIRICYRWVDDETTVRVNVGDSANSIYIDGTQEVVTDSLGNTATAQMLLSVGDYKDTQEVLTGSVTRNIGIKVLDGSEDWAQYSASNKIYTFSDATTMSHPQDVGCLCSHFITSSEIPSATVNTNELFLHPTTSRVYICFPDIVGDVSAFKQWLSTQYANGTPVIIALPIATPTTSTVSGQFLSKSPVTQTAGAISGLTITTTESAHTTPTPQQPLQINCNNGVVKLSKNLFDNGTLYNWYFINGTVTYNASRYAKYMSISSSKTYTISRNDNYDVPLRIVQTEITPDDGVNYNIDGTTTFLSIARNQFPFTFTSRGSAKFLVLSTDSSLTEAQSIDLFNKLQLELGSTATPYTPYSPNGIYTDGTTETVEITGDNLIDLNAVTDGYYYDPSGTYTSSSTSRLTDYMPVEAGRSVTVYFKSLSAGILNVRINIFNSNKVWQSQEVLQLAPEADGTKIITPTANGYIRISANYVSPSNVDWDTASVTESFGTATAENLFKVGTYQDEQSVIDGGVTRNVGIKVLDGTENWASLSGYMSISKTDLGTNSTVLPASSTSIFCTHFQVKTGSFVDGIGVGNSYVNFKYDSVFTTLAQWTQYLADQYNAGTPVIVAYPISSPTTETVTGQPLSIQAGTNIVEITQGSIDGLGLEVSYKATV